MDSSSSVDAQKVDSVDLNWGHCSFDACASVADVEFCLEMPRKDHRTPYHPTHSLDSDHRSETSAGYCGDGQDLGGRSGFSQGV